MPAPRLSSPSVLHVSVRRFSGRQWIVHPCPRLHAVLWPSGLYRAMRTSLPPGGASAWGLGGGGGGPAITAEGSTPVGTCGGRCMVAFWWGCARGTLVRRRGSGAALLRLPGAACAPWRPSHAGAGVPHLESFAMGVRLTKAPQWGLGSVCVRVWGAGGGGSRVRQSPMFCIRHWIPHEVLGILRIHTLGGKNETVTPRPMRPASKGDHAPSPASAHRRTPLGRDGRTPPPSPQAPSRSTTGREGCTHSPVESRGPENSVKPGTGMYNPLAPGEAPNADVKDRRRSHPSSGPSRPISPPCAPHVGWLPAALVHPSQAAADPRLLLGDWPAPIPVAIPR